MNLKACSPTSTAITARMKAIFSARSVVRRSNISESPLMSTSFYQTRIAPSSAAHNRDGLQSNLVAFGDLDSHCLYAFNRVQYSWSYSWSRLSRGDRASRSGGVLSRYPSKQAAKGCTLFPSKRVSYSHPQYSGSVG